MRTHQFERQQSRQFRAGRAGCCNAQRRAAEHLCPADAADDYAGRHPRPGRAPNARRRIVRAGRRPATPWRPNPAAAAPCCRPARPGLRTDWPPVTPSAPPEVSLRTDVPGGSAWPIAGISHSAQVSTVPPLGPATSQCGAVRNGAVAALGRPGRANDRPAPSPRPSTRRRPRRPSVSFIRVFPPDCVAFPIGARRRANQCVRVVGDQRIERDAQPLASAQEGQLDQRRRGRHLGPDGLQQRDSAAIVPPVATGRPPPRPVGPA